MLDFGLAKALANEDSAIYLATLDGKERLRLMGARHAAAYAPPASDSENGHLLFLRAGTLMAQPLMTSVSSSPASRSQ